MVGLSRVDHHQRRPREWEPNVGGGYKRSSTVGLFIHSGVLGRIRMGGIQDVRIIACLTGIGDFFSEHQSLAEPKQGGSLLRVQ